MDWMVRIKKTEGGQDQKRAEPGSLYFKLVPWLLLMSRDWYLGATALPIRDDVSLIGQLRSRPQPFRLAVSDSHHLGPLSPWTHCPWGTILPFLILLRATEWRLELLQVPYSPNPNENCFSTWPWVRYLLLVPTSLHSRSTLMTPSRPYHCFPGSTTMPLKICLKIPIRQKHLCFNLCAH